MSEWTTPTKTGKNTKTVTPDATKGEPILQFTTDNPYDVFTVRSTTKDYDKESDESSDSSIGTNNSESSNDSDNSSMSEPTFTSVAGLLKEAKANMVPITEPTKVDIVTFRRCVASALTRCASATLSKGGHAFLILDESDYRNRLQDQKAALPTMPKTPIRPDDTANKHQWYTYKYNVKVYEQSEAYDQQVKELIIAKFPGGLTGKKDKEGYLPINLTAKEALGYIEGKLRDNAQTNACFRRVLLDVMQRSHVRAANGAEDWFKAAEDNRMMAKELGFPYIAYHIIMSSAEEAFRESGFDKESVYKIDAEWKRLMQIKNYKVDSDECYEEFKDHYNKGLSLLYIHDDKKQSANLAGVLEDRMADMELDMGQLFVNQKALSSERRDRDIDNQTAATTPSTINVPKGDGTAASSVTTEQFRNMEERLATSMKASIVAAMAAAPTNGNNNRRESGREKVWKQYTEWCYSCGVNLSHITKDHKGGRRSSGHNDHLNATRTDPQGGNMKKDHLWHKWNSPEGKICDTCGT